jgi:hypothetical protein
MLTEKSLNVVTSWMRELQSKAKKAGSDMELIKSILSEFKEAQELRNLIVRELQVDKIGGDDESKQK